MPTFDIVSKIETHEILNAVDQANREVTTRFDFKDTGAKYELNKDNVTMIAQTEFQLKQMDEILLNKFSKRQIDIRALEHKNPQLSLNEARQVVNIKQGIQSEIAKKIVKFIKDTQAKVQASIQGDQVRVAGKKRDDLQEIIARLRKEDFGLPLQFENFRD